MMSIGTRNKSIQLKQAKGNRQNAHHVSTVSHTCSKLSPREIEVGYLVVEGNSAREIAEMLYITPKTVEQHIYHMKKKLGCGKKFALIKCLLQALNL
ncbi:MAG: helix-turn-helix transcriptional regulator [Gammaproteobacteria bacterium]